MPGLPRWLRGAKAQAAISAVFCLDMLILTLSLILGLLPLAILIVTLSFTEETWTWGVVKWRHEVVFTGFLVSFIAFIQFIGVMRDRKRATAFSVTYLLIVLPAFACAMILGFYNSRDASEAVLGVEGRGTLEIPYRIAADLSLMFATLLIVLSLLLVVWKQFGDERRTAVSVDMSDVGGEEILS